MNKTALTKEEQQALDKACHDDIDRLILWGLLDTGIRIREWCNIDGWRIIDTQKTGNNLLSIGDGKHARKVPVSNRFLRVAVAYFQKNPVGGSMPLKARAAEYRLRDIEKRAGFSGRVTPATLRITFVTNSINRGMAEQDLRAILGSWPLGIRRLCEELTKPVVSK
jgi:site-specific recombinase XerD